MLLIALFTLLTATASATVTDCNSSSIFRPTTLALTPDPPVKDQPVKLSLVFDNTGSEVTNGTVTNTITYNGLPFTPSIKPLCEDTACPILVGSNDRSADTNVPAFTGKVLSHIVWTGSNDEVLLCIDMTLKIV